MEYETLEAKDTTRQYSVEYKGYKIQVDNGYYHAKLSTATITTASLAEIKQAIDDVCGPDKAA